MLEQHQSFTRQPETTPTCSGMLSPPSHDVHAKPVRLPSEDAQERTLALRSAACTSASICPHAWLHAERRSCARSDALPWHYMLRIPKHHKQRLFQMAFWWLTSLESLSLTRPLQQAATQAAQARLGRAAAGLPAEPRIGQQQGQSGRRGRSQGTPTGQAYQPLPYHLLKVKNLPDEERPPQKPTHLSCCVTPGGLACCDRSSMPPAGRRV